MDEQEEGGAVMTIPKAYNNQMINQLQTIETKFRDLGNGYRDWVSKQIFPVEATSSAIQGAACGALIGAVAQVAGHVFLPQHSRSIKAFSSSPITQARTLAAIGGVHASINCIMKRIRGKEDAQTRMAAGFGAGATLSLITRMGKPYVAVDTVVIGVICALVGGSVKFQTSQPTVEYTRTRSMLSNLGLQNYEVNFKKGLLTDKTTHLLTESILKDVGVPPGPRLLILEHLERDPELQKLRRGRAGLN